MAERERSRSRGGSGDQRGNADKKVGWPNGFPKARNPEFPPPPTSPPSNSLTPFQATQRENATIVELRNVIERQNALIRDLMSRLEKMENTTHQKEPNKHEETIASDKIEGPRKLPRRRSPPPAVLKSTPPTQNVGPQKQEEMEAEEVSQGTNKQTNTTPRAEEQIQMSPGETAILAALRRLEDRMTTLEAKHDRLATRVNSMEVRNRYASLKKDRAERLKETIAKRRGRLGDNAKDDAEPQQ